VRVARIGGVETPQEPMDEKQHHMRQLEGRWDAHKFDLYYRRARKELESVPEPEEVLERVRGEADLSARGCNTKSKKRGQRSDEGSRLRNVLVGMLRVAGRGVWHGRNWLLLVAILGLGRATVVSALAGSDLQTIACGGLVALLGAVLFIFA